jgi:hypothetical protein
MGSIKHQLASKLIYVARVTFPLPHPAASLQPLSGSVSGSALSAPKYLMQILLNRYNYQSFLPIDPADISSTLLWYH